MLTPSALPRKPTFQPEIVMSSSTVRACSAMSPARPALPLGSAALKAITHAGAVGSGSASAGASAAEGEDFIDGAPVGCRGAAKGVAKLPANVEECCAGTREFSSLLRSAWLQ